MSKRGRVTTRRAVRPVMLAPRRKPAPAQDALFRSVRRDPPIARELAGLVQTSHYYFRGGEVPPLSEILLKRSKSGWKLGQLWDDMLARDTFLAGLWMKRWKAYLGLPRYILPHDETPRAKEMALFARLALSEVPGLHTNLVHQAQMLTHAWAADEMLWQLRDRGPIKGKWGLDLVDRPMWRFAYKMLPVPVPGSAPAPGEPQQLEPVLHVRRLGGSLVPAPPGKFLIARAWSKDNPWGGLGLLHHTYWYSYASEHAWKYWAVLIEKWAQPTAVGRYPRSRDPGVNEASVQTLFQAIDQIQTEYSIVVPSDLVIDLLEAKRGGEVSYKEFVGQANLAKALVMLGEADTSGAEQGQGSFARRRVSNEVRLETIRIDAHESDAHLTDNLLKPLIEVNFGPDAPAPYWWTEVDDAEDLKMRQERADALIAQGLPVPLDDYYRLNLVRMPRQGESILRSVAAPAVEGVDAPQGFPMRAGAGDLPLPLSASDLAAVSRHRAGDLHHYRLLN